MRTFVLSTILLLQTVLLQAQTPPAAQSSGVVSLPATETLTPFSAVEVNGAMKVRLVKTLDPSQLKIVYDTKGSITTRLKCAVNKDGVLSVTETIDPKRQTITDVTIYYFSLKSLSVARASVSFTDQLQGTMLDLTVTSGGTLTADVNVSDLAMTSTGKSSSVITGTARYFKLDISTAKFDGGNLQTVSSYIDSSHGAEARVQVSERIEAVTSTSGTVMYRGNPTIARNKSALFGGDITTF